MRLDFQEEGGKNTQELEREVCRLMEIKNKNEEKIPRQELMTRYRKSYCSLCEKLEDAQEQLRARYRGIMEGLSKIMEDSVSMDPDEKAALLDERLNEEAERWNFDPVAKVLYLGFYHRYSGNEKMKD